MAHARCVLALLRLAAALRDLSDDVSLMQLPLAMTPSKASAAATCTEAIDMSTHDQAKSYSNLDGQGPDSGPSDRPNPSEIRVSGVGTESSSGKSIDLVLTNSGPYYYNDINNNEIYSGEAWTQVNNNAGRTLNLQGNFYKQGTSESITLQKSKFTLCDIDQEKFKVREFYTISADAFYLNVGSHSNKYDDFIISYDQAVQIETQGNVQKVTATSGGKLRAEIKSTLHGEGFDNPESPKNLEDDQAKKCIMFELVQASGFNLEFECGGTTGSSASNGRNMLIGGPSTYP